MDFKTDKLLRRIMEISGYRYIDNKSVTDIYFLEDKTKTAKYPPNETDDWKLFDKNSVVNGRDRYYWFKCSVSIPELSGDERFVLLLDFSKYIGGRIRELEGYEALAFLNGKVYQGMDQNHKELILDSSYSMQVITFSFKLWTGLEAGGPIQDIEHRLNYLNSALLCFDTDDLYFNTKLLYKTIMSITEDDPVKEKLLTILDKTYQLIDWSYPGEDLFYASISKANSFIVKKLLELENNPESTVTGIGHTHIDVAWLWRLKHTREKAARSFSTVLRLMDNYPDYTFLQSQPQLYEYIKDDYPEIYEEMKKRIDEGRWEADGATWLEPDCNLPSGESLIRQLLFGAHYFKKEFGKDINYLWLPDVFGYSWALPQLLKKSGIDMLLTTKLSWNQYNRMPNDTFIWKGIDGSEVYTHFITTPNPNSSDTSVGAVYSGLMEPATVKGIHRNYKNKSLNSNFLLAYGHGDGGGGTDREMVELLNRMNRYTIPTLPKVKAGKAVDYFNELKQTIQAAPKTEVETWDGELYLEYHRGTYTSQAENKAHNRRLELLYRDIEWMSSVSALNNQTTYLSDQINEGWKVILRNQFHDILPGCSIKEVYQDSEKEYAAAYRYAGDILENEIIQNKSDNRWTLFNSASWDRSDYITIKGQFDKESIWKDEEGNRLESSVKSDEVLLFIKDMAALSSVVITCHTDSEKNESSTENYTINDHSVQSPHYSIEWNTEGKLTRIYDREQQREVLKGNGNVLELFEDKPLAYDAWDIDIYYQEKGKTLSAEDITIAEVTPLHCKVQFCYSFGNSSIVQDMIIYTHSRRIDFETKVNWQERQQLLKAGFNVNIRSVQATYDIQFGYANRPTHWNTSWDKARFESVGHQWVDLSETGYGVSLLNDSKYGHDIKGNRIRLSLLTGSINPNPDADRGNHEFTYSLLPHNGDFLSAKTPEEAWALNNNLHILNADTVDLTRPFYFESKESVFVDAFKQAENKEGYILRIHDHTGGSRKVTIRLNGQFSHWCESNLLEKQISGWNSIGNQTIELQMNPFEIVTLRLK